MRGRRNLGLDYAGLHDRYLAGESSAEIASSVGIDPSGLRRAWIRRGLPIRTGSEAKHAHYERYPGTASVDAAHAAARGRAVPMAERVQRAKTRERLMLGTSAREDEVADRLSALGIPFRRQVAVGPYNVDFVVGDIALDIDGGGHNPRIRARRPERTATLRAAGYRVVAVNVRGRDWLTRAIQAVG